MTITFPKLSEEKMAQMLALPAKEGKLRVVIDTDTHNEIDDQFALAWALQSQDRLEIEGVYAAPYSFAHHRQPLLDAYEEIKSDKAITEEDVTIVGSYHKWANNLIAAGTDPYSIHFAQTDEGMELSYQEILKVFELMDEDPAGKVFRGSTQYLPGLDGNYRSEAVDHLIERAMAHDDQDRPLYVVGIGAATNIAAAILVEPKIIEKIVVVWTSAFPSFSNQCNRLSLNFLQDLPASRLMFDSGVPHVYLPGFYIGAQLMISLPEMETWVKGRGKIGDYLHHLYTNNPIHKQRGITEQFGRTWVMWDLINIAWLLDPEWVPSQILPSPAVDDEMYWVHEEGRHMMREASGINRDGIFRDFFTKLEKAP
jgi:purine nucleosidase